MSRSSAEAPLTSTCWSAFISALYVVKRTLRPAVVSSALRGVIVLTGLFHLGFSISIKVSVTAADRPTYLPFICFHYCLCSACLMFLFSWRVFNFSQSELACLWYYWMSHASKLLTHFKASHLAFCLLHSLKVTVGSQNIRSQGHHSRVT